ncbi:MAG: nickel-responsive transcriptional regulator NikR [Gemmatales bacterium]|nr:nickel-responsive transcriptional regulator NikR [Gemmatales bacterium]MDW7995907.1 nickel-responsive transcriptional regulator NikR [Gemmatales bacterium]
MSQVVRFSVSLEAQLLEEFDRYCQTHQYPTRSEAVRHLIREKLNQDTWQANEQEVTATLTLIYDHHRSQLVSRLLELQHDHAEHVISTMHVHLDHDRCLEVIVLRGPARQLRGMVDRLRALKGVSFGQLVVASGEPRCAGSTPPVGRQGAS